jgi:hypothetical protein
MTEKISALTATIDEKNYHIGIQSEAGCILEQKLELSMETIRNQDLVIQQVPSYSPVGAIGLYSPTSKRPVQVESVATLWEEVQSLRNESVSLRDQLDRERSLMRSQDGILKQVQVQA